MTTENEKPTFGEVMAYVHGVADAVAAQSANASPQSTAGAAPAPTGRRYLTLPYVPYRAPRAATPSRTDPLIEERESGVRLRAPELSLEWHELTEKAAGTAG